MEMRTVPIAELLPAGTRLMLRIGAGHPLLVPTGTDTTVSVQTGEEVRGDVSLPVVRGRISFDAADTSTGEEIWIGGRSLPDGSRKVK